MNQVAELMREMEIRKARRKIQNLAVAAEGNFSVSFYRCCATVYREDELLAAGHVLVVLRELRKELGR